MATPEQNEGSDLSERAVTPSAAAGEHRLPAVLSQTSHTTPKSTRRLWLWVMGAVFAGMAALGLYFQPWAAGPVPVAVETAVLAPVTRVLAVNGRIAALHSVDVRAQVSGILADVSVAEGDSVQSDAVIARIDAAAQQAILRQTMAGLDAALVAQEQALATLDRTRALGANVARTALETAESAAQTATQEVARMTALADQAQIQLANYAIRAPMTGTVLALDVEPGQSIDPATVLLTIADLGQLVVETDVDEAYAAQIRVDMPAVMQLTGEQATRAGRVSFVSRRVDPATGGLAVKLAFDEPVSAPVGLTVTANIVIDRQDAAMTVPRTAILGDGAMPAVFVVEDGIARRRAVAMIDWPAARLIVTDGLSPGDVLILDATGVAEGQSVRVVQP